MSAQFVSNFSPSAEQKHERIVRRSETDGKSARVNAVLQATSPNTKSLLIWNAGKFDTSLLARFNELERLSVFCWPDSTLDALLATPQLRELALMGIGKVHSLAPLAHLKPLRRLELWTLTSSLRPQVIDSFCHLSELSHLEHLVACDFWPEDRSIRTFERLAPLKTADVTDWLTLSQRAKVAALGHPIRDAVLEADIACSKCPGKRTLLYGIATRRKWYCSECDADVIASHRASYTALLNSAKRP